MLKKEYSILIGGQAGDGIKRAGNVIARLFNRLGYWTFIYEDYPSIIRGGHNFSVIRAASKKISAHKDYVDIIVALNQETVEKHNWRVREKENSLIIFDSTSTKAEGLGIPLAEIVKNKELPKIARNNTAIGALAQALGIEFSIVKNVITSTTKKKVAENIGAAQEAYNLAKNFKQIFKLPILKNPPKPLLTGNEAIALGAVKAGLKLYIAYPMTPATSILHYLAKHEKTLNIRTVHPENEIAAIGMAQGAAFAGVKTMTATSGGGFALMVEHISLAGQAEIPTPVVISQRPGPSTGVPTYTTQGDLFFALHAGHGLIPKIVLAPADVEEAFYLAGEAMNLAWKFQIPVILLSDKHLSESTFTAQFDEKKVKEENPKQWKNVGEYKRYILEQSGISPLAFPGNAKATVKSNSYEHNEFGLTIEEPELVEKSHHKRLRKIKTIENFLKKRETVKVFGNPKSKTALITWGSTRPAVVEAVENYDLKIIQPLFLHPLPIWEIKKHLTNVEKIIDIEVNTTGQLAALLNSQGIRVDEKVLKYDGRPFTVNELEEKLKIWK